MQIQVKWMEMKSIASLLMCAIMLFTVGPSKAFAQTPGQAAVARREQTSEDAQAKSKLDLKTRFAEEIANFKASPLSADDLKRLEVKRLSSQFNAQPKSGFSKKEKILAVFIVIAITGLAIVLAHNGVDPKPRCEDEPGTPDCIP